MISDENKNIRMKLFDLFRKHFIQLVNPEFVNQYTVYHSSFPQGILANTRHNQLLLFILEYPKSGF